MTVTYIEDSAKLESCAKRLDQLPEIAIDLEFDKNFYRYGFNLCLVQIYSGKECYLIDPLGDNLEIGILFPILENPGVQKICFSFDEDLRLLHSMGCFPKNLYDLGTASRLLNYPQTSLTNLVEEELAVDTGKSSQTSNWYKRPLSEGQLHYAAQDVLHLIKLKEIFEKKAEIKGVSGWIEDENSSLDELDYSELDHNNNIKEKDKGDLTEHEWHVFKKLMEFRQQIAREVNRPGFQIVKKEYLADIAKDSRSLMKWTQKKGIYRGIKNNKYKNRILNLLKDASEEAEQLGLSKSKQATKTLSEEKYAELRREKSRVSQLKSAIFDPIKEQVEEDYGKDTATFLLSNRIVEDIITGKNGDLPNYKKELILKYAEELSLDVDEVLKEIFEDEQLERREVK